MESNKEADKPKTNVSYYGKKWYDFNPMIARKQQRQGNIPDYSREESESIVYQNKK